MFIAAGSPGHPQLRRSGMFIGTATNNGLRKAWNLVCCPIRHAAPDGAWFSGEAPQLKTYRSYGAMPDGPPPQAPSGAACLWPHGLHGSR